MMNHYGPNTCTMTFQAIFLVEEGASPQEVDRVNEDFGMPMGPFKVRDLSGNSSPYCVSKMFMGFLLIGICIYILCIYLQISEFFILKKKMKKLKKKKHEFFWLMFAIKILNMKEN